MAKPLGGGGGDREILGVCASVGVYIIFDPVMHITIALDEFEED